MLLWRVLCWSLVCVKFVTTQPTFYSTSYAYQNGQPQTFQVPSGIANGTLFLQLQGALVEEQQVDWVVTSVYHFML